MKIYMLPAIGTLLFTGTMVAVAKPKTATPVKIKPNQIHEEPYRFNGAVLTDDARGSGFCAWNKRTFFSAAHVVFSETDWKNPPVWYPAVNSADLNSARAIQSRGYYRWTAYADRVAAEGPNQSAFGQDVILGFAFKELIHSSPASLNLNGSADLKKNIRTMITGYPAEKAYTASDIAGYFLHKTGPSVTPYESYSGRALTTTLVSTGPGNSGGPIWTRNSKSGWSAAGVLVGGLPSESVVYSFSNDINSLIRAVTPVVQPKIESPVSVSNVSATSLFFPYVTPRKIPDGVHEWTSFRINVNKFEEGSKVVSVKLSLDIRTRHRGDLQVMVEGPGGYQALVHNEEGAGNDNLIIKNRDFSEHFTDIDPNGVWTVRVQDRLTGDVATLKSILLEISADAPATTAVP